MAVTGGEEEVQRDAAEVRLTNSEWLSQIDQKLSHLQPDQRRQMKQLIEEFACLFPDTPSATHLIQHDVDVGDAKPVKQHPYRMNPQKLAILEKEIQYLLDNGILEHSNSEWASPCVLVSKGIGQWRLCADLRRVNQCVRDDGFPLPRIDDCIDKVGAAQFISKLDLLKGYHQIPLSDRAKRVLAICTPTGLYQYKRLPFGLKTAPAAFQRLMNCVLGDLPCVFIFIDDGVVANMTWEEHLHYLRQVFQRLKDANLTVNLSKCEFGQARVTFLGHVVGLGKVAPVDAKVNGINDFARPRSGKDVRRFLGMAGYYRRFCPNFASVTVPLTSLLKKGVKFKWTEECERAFNQVKAMLSSPPVLRAPDFQRPFQLAVDASATGSGAVLFQRGQDGLDHPVSYLSKKFNKHQLNYSTVEKEALALIQALQHYEVYLKPTAEPVQVFTDHNPLTFIHRCKSSNQRVLRWSLLLQDYDLSINHIPGSENVVADALSRAS